MYKDRLTLILRLLALVAFALVFVMALRTSERASVLGRYSPQYFGYLVEMLVYSICLGIFSFPAVRTLAFRHENREISDRNANLLVIAAVFATPIIYIIAHQTGVIPYIRYTFLLILPPVLMALLLCRLGKLNSSFTLIPWPVVVFFFLFLQVLLIVHLFGDIPRFDDNDETWEIGDAVYVYHNYGVSRNLLPERTAEDWIDFSFLSYVKGAWFEIVGVGWLQARAFQLVLAIVALPFIYSTAKRVYGPIAGWSAALLAFYILLHYNWARSDVWVATATAISTHLYFAAREDRTKRRKLASAACGFFIISTVEGHFYGIAFAAMFCLYHLVEQLVFLNKHGWRVTANFLTFMCGCLAFCMFWFWYHVHLPGLTLAELPQIFSKTYAWEVSGGYGNAGMQRILGNFYKLLRYFFTQNSVELFLSMAVVIAALVRRIKAERFVLVVSGGSLTIVVVIMAHARMSYFLFWMPYVAIFFGAFVQDLCKKSKFDRYLSMPRVTNGAVLFLSTVLVLYVVEAFRDASESDTIRNREHLETLIDAGERFDEILPKEDIVISGNFPFYLGMSHRLNYHARFWGEPIILQELIAEQPKALILILGEHEEWSGVAEYLERYSFVAVECIPLPDMDSFFGRDMGQNRNVILLVYPDYAPGRPSEACTPEMLAWLNA